MDTPVVGETLTIREVCQHLRVSRNTAYALIQRGELPAFRVGAQALRVLASDLEQYIARQKERIGTGARSARS